MSERLLEDLERLLTAGLAEDARRVGLAESTARVLLVLDEAREVSMSELADRLGRSPSTATRFVDRAAREGLVRREPGLDRRRRLASLTSGGEAARQRLLALRASRAQALPRLVRRQTGLGPAEVGWFLGALVEALREAPRP